MLFDPFEKQFYLPTRLVDLRDCECRQREIVSQKLEALSRLHIEVADAAQWIWVNHGGVDRRQDDRVIGSDAGSFVQRDASNADRAERSPWCAPRKRLN